MSDPQPQDNRPFVLIADDDPDTLDILCIFAERKGWRVERATTARGIIEKVNCHCAEEGRCPDAILSDVNFFDNQPGPRLTGITAIGQIRKRWPHIPVVFYSAFLNTAMRGLIRELGNTQAIEKGVVDPVGPIEMVEMVMRFPTGHSRYEGQDRRRQVGQSSDHPHRRKDDCKGDISVPPVLEGAMVEARAIRELHAAATAPRTDSK